MSAPNINRLAINGAAGRMGQSVVRAISHSQAATLAAAYENSASPQLGEDAGGLAGIGGADVAIEASSAIATGRFDTLIDFSVPESALAALAACADSGRSAVIGVTGFDDAQIGEIRELSNRMPIVLAPNMSLGVNLCFKLVEQAAAILAGSADIEIMEMHHRHKRDAPSGTSLKMGEIIAQQIGTDLNQAAVYNYRDLSEPRSKRNIGFQVMRVGDTVGEHTAVFALDGERVEISHKAFSRLAFANGAVRAAIWVKGKQAGLYDMSEVLGL